MIEIDNNIYYFVVFYYYLFIFMYNFRFPHTHSVPALYCLPTLNKKINKIILQLVFEFKRARRLVQKFFILLFPFLVYNNE